MLQSLLCSVCVFVVVQLLLRMMRVILSRLSADVVTETL